jgi:uncharacterized surface protein with fasciclin (FAS1) repeats
MKRPGLLAIFIFFTATIFAQTLPPPNSITAPINTIQPNTVNSAPAHVTAKRSAAVTINTITDNIATTKTLSSFYKLVQAAGLTETFKSAGPITLFAPDNQAFEKMPKGKLDTLLMPNHKYELIAFITYHAIAGKINSKNIISQIGKHKNVATFTTLSGGKLTAKLGADHHLILFDETGSQSMVTQSDIIQGNGVLFVISGVLIPKNRLF